MGVAYLAPRRNSLLHADIALWNLLSSWVVNGPPLLNFAVDMSFTEMELFEGAS